MSKYTTGEMAKLCGVSVRTVQYYDTRNILVPSELSEGGRRLYSEEDLKRMRIICFLREAGVPINRIGELFADEHPEKIVSVLLDQQEQELQDQLDELQRKLSITETIKRELREIEHFSVESIHDIAHVMKSKSKLRKMRWFIVLTGLPLEVLEWVSIIWWIKSGVWWLFLVWLAVVIVYGVWVLAYYFGRVAYICPECHEVFQPSIKEVFWAYHTPKMRRLTCPKCGRKGLCVEVYAEKENDNG